MHHSSFRVASWGLLAGFALSIAVAVTDPEEVRLALHSEAPAQFDASEIRTLIARHDAWGSSSAAAPAQAPQVPAGHQDVGRPHLPTERDLIANDVAEQPAIFADTTPLDEPIPARVIDDRLVMNPHTMQFVPPFEVSERPVPRPPVEHRIDRAERQIDETQTPLLPQRDSFLDVGSLHQSGVPIEIDLGGPTPRIQVLMTPSQRGKLVELPVPPGLDPDPDSFASHHVADGSQDDLSEQRPSGFDPAEQPVATGIVSLDTVRGPVLPSTALPVEATPLNPRLDELKSQFEEELASLRRELHSLTSRGLEQQIEEIRHAERLLQEVRTLRELDAMRVELDRFRHESRESTGTANTPDDLPRVVITPSSVSGRINVDLRSATASEAFAALGVEAGINLLPTDIIQGEVTAHLRNITPWEAVVALAHSRGWDVVERSGMYVVVPQSAAEDSPSATEPLYSQLIHPVHLSAVEVARLLEPLLTPGVGRISATRSNESTGVTLTEAVLIVDTHDVIRRALAVVTAVDQPPRQIEVSAQVLLVRRSGLLRDGVMAAVRRGHLTPGHLPPTVNFSCDGLPPGSCGSSAGLTVPAEELCRRLKQLTEVQVVATPHIQVLDRHAAEIGIEDQTAFRVFSAWGCPRSEQIEFLENGSRLWIRPTITTGNMIRLELAPRRSVVEVPRRGLPRQSTAEVTTDILIPHGCTLLVGGMWQEMTLERSRGVPVVGSWPGFDHLLSRRPAVTESAELVVLVTPWIVESAVQQTAVPW